MWIKTLKWIIIFNLSITFIGCKKIYRDTSASVLAFTSARDIPIWEVNIWNTGRLYLMNEDGTNQFRLTNGDANMPCWSPDGKKIAFIGMNKEKMKDEIYIIDANGENQIIVPTLNLDPTFGLSWAPDGKKLAFAAKDMRNKKDMGNKFINAQEDIYIINVDGTNVKRITNTPGDESFPDWSPDGKEILFNYSPAHYTYEVWIMNIEGTDRRRLLKNGFIGPGSWSPDGKKILVALNQDIYVMDREGTNIKRLTYNKFVMGRFCWSPDGKKIAYASNQDGKGNAEIYIMDADGTNHKRLTYNPATDWFPSWRPIVKK